jgi:membrane peptidoglycan carboxypeptidase
MTLSEPGQPRRRRRLWPWLLPLLVILIAALIAAYELIASPFQAMVLAGYGKRLTYATQAGPSDSIRFPEFGPHDLRLGYARLPAITERMTRAEYTITRQARVSPEMAKLADFGLFLPYREKSSAGLTLLDCAGTPLYKARSPERGYAEFSAIPPVVANTLLFIENRELLDPNHPRRNPAVEWDRLAQALLEKAIQVVSPNRNVPGGSTLATQIEKYRHSPDGLTMTAGDKFTQMASASIRAYLDGTDTRATRRQIVLSYLNSVPLAAAPGFGEVHGLGDALEAWFGLDFDEVNQLLRQPHPTPESARVYKHVLALLISQRKPSWYLLTGRKHLDAQADAHLRLLTDVGVISPALRDLALAQRITFRSRDKNGADGANATPAARDKAVSAMRVEIGNLIGIPLLYDLDRLDLSVRSTLHGPTQLYVSETLRRLKDPEFVAASGLFGEHLLSPGNDLAKVLYSFTLYELSDQGAQLRVQADNLDQPFDLNQGAKLDMGSSAKLRTLITYLNLVAELHYQYAPMSNERLDEIKVADKDVLSRWAIDYLRSSNDRSLEPMIEAAMGRSYSANPSEAFFTGGGLHYFANFKHEDDGRVMNLWEATRNSVNLPFIRLMRDIVRHLMYRSPSIAGRILADAENPQRTTYLHRFADKEGREFLARFYRKYKGLTPDQATDALINHLSANPRRLAAVFRYLEPRLDIAGFTKLMQTRLANPSSFDDKDYQSLYTDYGPEKFNLSDRGYIIQTHPLELWLVAYLRQHPGATWHDIVENSASERVEVYQWLYSASRKDAQDSRIQSLLEIEAFQEIHKRWRRLGYPFSSLVPSYASAIGSSADRPAALAELIGILLNDGVKLPEATLRELDFGADTPYHTVFTRKAPRGERIIPAPLARVVRKALVNVVKEGTARRLSGVFKTSAGEITVGGKTGTGDHRRETFSSSGALLESKVMNRVATFAFFIGARHYGVITAFVPGEEAGNYHFTSGLPVQLLKTMAPNLMPLLTHTVYREPTWDEAVAAFEADAPTRPTPPKPTLPDQPAPPPAPPTTPVPAPALIPSRELHGPSGANKPAHAPTPIEPSMKANDTADEAEKPAARTEKPKVEKPKMDKPKPPNPAAPPAPKPPETTPGEGHKFI